MRITRPSDEDEKPTYFGRNRGGRDNVWGSPKESV